MKYCLLFITSIVFVQPLIALTYGGDEVPILYVPVSARSTALGNSLYCSEDESIRYNPAYLGNLEHNYFYATYGSFLQDTNFGSFAMQVKTGNVGWALGYSELRSSFDNYTGPDTARDGSIAVSQSLFTIASGIRGTDENFLLGTAVRILSDSIESQTSNGYNMDVGGGYLFGPRFRVGLVVKNALTIASRSDDKVGQNVVLSAAWNPPFLLPHQERNSENTLSLAVNKNVTTNATLSAGWESVLYRRFSARIGLDRDYPALGLGFLHGMLNLDVSAAFKEQGLLYFMTVGWKFGGETLSDAKAQKETNGEDAPQEIVTAGVLQQTATPDAVQQAPDPEQDKRAQMDALIKDGWSCLQENRLKDALDRFNAALTVDPNYQPALYGQQMTQKELERYQRKETVSKYIAQGREALNKGDYLGAHKSYRSALESDPESEMAKEGIRQTVEYAVREIGENLKAATGQQIEFMPLSQEDALNLSENGTFVNFVASLRHLASRRYREGYAEWQKVQPQDNPVVEKYAAAFKAAVTGEFDGALAKAMRLANNGAYASAIAQLNGTLKMPGLGDDEVRKIHGLIISYEYVGKAIAKNYLAKADMLVQQRQYRSATLCLERVVKCGFDADRANKMLADIKGRQDEQDDDGTGESAVQVQDTGTMAAPSGSGAQSVAPLPGTGVHPKPSMQGTEQKKSDVSPMLKERLLKEYRQKASALSAQNRFKECREYLLRVLYLEPDDADAKRSLERIDGILKTRGE
jgi:tetratricopeptide (TPR) repeat protein